jgi:hypothetical protein
LIQANLAKAKIDNCIKVELERVLYSFKILIVQGSDIDKNSISKVEIEKIAKYIMQLHHNHSEFVARVKGLRSKISITI